MTLSFKRMVHAVDSHTEGNPTRVVVGGLPVPPGATLAERTEWLKRNDDALRRLLNFEPRGNPMMGSPWENGYVESFNARLRESCSTARSSTLSARRRSSSRAGAGITMPSGRMRPSATRHRPPRCSCQLSPHGRLRNPDQLRRPCYPWRPDQP
jgi:hypothetical protein